jgi:two-component system OmpR family response regulator
MTDKAAPLAEIDLAAYTKSKGGRAMRILIIEDDDQTADYMAKGLSEAGHVVDRAADGRDGLYMASGGDYDAVVLDRMLPQLDGLKVLEALRAANIHTPVLILSALGQVDDRVSGLRAGGDDYLTKPFAFSELLARLESMTRRHSSSAPETTLTVGDLSLDRLSRKVTRAGQSVDLQPREFQLLEFLMRHAGQVVTRTMLLEGVWDYHFDPQTNVIDVHMSRLRQKVDKGFDRQLIQTVRGAGYMLSADG